MSALTAVQKSFGLGHVQIRAAVRDMVALYDTWRRPVRAAV